MIKNIVLEFLNCLQDVKAYEIKIVQLMKELKLTEFTASEPDAKGKKIKIIRKGDKITYEVQDV